MADQPTPAQSEAGANLNDTSAFMGFLAPMEAALFPDPPAQIPTPEVASEEIPEDQPGIVKPPAEIQDGGETPMAASTGKVHRRPPKPYGSMGLRRGSSQSAVRAEGPAKRPKTRSAVETGDRSAVQVLPLCAEAGKSVKPKQHRAQVHLVYGNLYDTLRDASAPGENRRSPDGPEVPLHHVVPLEKSHVAPNLVGYDGDASGDDDAFDQLQAAAPLEQADAADEVTLFSPPAPRRWENLPPVPKTPAAVGELSGMDVEVSPIVEVADPQGVEVRVRVEKDQDGQVNRETIDKLVNMGLQRAATMPGDCDLVARLQPRRTSMPNVSPIRATDAMEKESDILAGVVINSTPLVGVAPLGRGRVSRSIDESVEGLESFDADYPLLSPTLDGDEVPTVATPAGAEVATEVPLPSAGGSPVENVEGPEWVPNLGVADSSDEEVRARGDPHFAAPETPVMPPPSSIYVPRNKITQERKAPSPERVYQRQAAFADLMASQPAAQLSPKWRRSPLQTASLMGRTIWRDGHVMPTRISVNMVYTDPDAPRKSYVVRPEDDEHLCEVLFVEEEQWRRILVPDDIRVAQAVPDDVLAILPPEFPRGLAGAQVLQMTNGKLMAALGAEASIQVKIAKQGKIDGIRARKAAEAKRVAAAKAEKANADERNGRLNTSRHSSRHSIDPARRSVSSPPTSEKREKSKREKAKETVNVKGHPRPNRRDSSSGVTDEEKERRHRGKAKDKKKLKQHGRRRSSTVSTSTGTSDQVSDDSDSSDGTPKATRKKKDRKRRSRSSSAARPSSQLEKTIVGVMERFHGLPTASVRPRGLQVKIEPYTGEPGKDGKVLPFKVWASHAELKLRAMGITSDADLVAQLPVILSGVILEEFSSLSDRDKRTFARCIDKLDQLLTPGGLGSAAATDAFMSRRQAAGETVVQFARALKLLAEKAHPDQSSRARGKMVKKVLVRGLHKKIRQDVALQRPETLERAIELAREAELGYNEYLVGDSSDESPKQRRSKAAAKATVNAIGVNLPAPLQPDRAKSGSDANLNTSGSANYGSQRQSQANQRDRRDIEDTYQFPGKCWNCMEVGHRQSDCPRPRTISNQGGGGFRGGRGGGGGYKGGGRGGGGFQENRQQNQQPAWLSSTQCQRLFNAFLESRQGEFGYDTRGGLPLTGGNAQQLGNQRVTIKTISFYKDYKDDKFPTRHA